MGLFHDDFYSTKVSRWNRMDGFRRFRNNNRLLWIIIASATAGMALMLMMFWLFGGSFGSRGDESVKNGLTNGDDRVVQAAAKVRPTVVSVISTFAEGDKGASTGTGIGSGIVFEKNSGKARIVTNNHVVEGASGYEVILSGGDRKKAVLVGTDRMTDLAVLEMDASGIKAVAEFGSSDSLKPGETAISIGNPLGLNYAQTVTVGVISSPKITIPVFLGKDGDYEWEMDVIQTDAAINKGNSGGALVTLDGKIVGINSLKVADSGVEGLGFAIPIDAAKPVLEKLIKDHKVNRPFIGVSTVNLQSFSGGVDALKLPADIKAGAVVIEASGPAKAAGLKMNDVIVALDDQPIDGTLALRKYLYSDKKIGDKLKIAYYRGSKKATVSVVLEELKDK